MGPISGVMSWRETKQVSAGGERVLEGKIGVEDLGFASRIGDEGGEFVELGVYPQNTYKSVRKIASGVKEFRQGREDFGAFGEGEEEVVAVLFGEDVGESERRGTVPFSTSVIDWASWELT